MLLIFFLTLLCGFCFLGVAEQSSNNHEIERRSFQELNVNRSLRPGRTPVLSRLKPATPRITASRNVKTHALPEFVRDWCAVYGIFAAGRDCATLFIKVGHPLWRCGRHSHHRSVLMQYAVALQATFSVVGRSKGEAPAGAATHD